jgi:hypothetical protein
VEGLQGPKLAPEGYSRETQGSGREKLADQVLQIIKLSQAGIREHLGRLLAKRELTYAPPSSTYFRMFDSTLNRDFERNLRFESHCWSMGSRTQSWKGSCKSQAEAEAQCSIV